MQRLLLSTFVILLISACSGGSSNSNAKTEIVPDPPVLIVKREYLWPLCGHITKNPPSTWSDADGCPDNRWNEDYNDFPLSSTYGPRLKASENFRYDYHRGIDIPTPNGTPIFSIKAGVVTRSGNNPQFSDLGITIQHYDHALTNCDISDCIHSLYFHLSQVSVSEGESVEKGQLIGYSGTTALGIDHLHFETRRSPGEHDAFSAWQRDAIHPLSVLPMLQNPTANEYTLEILNPLITGLDDLSFDLRVTSIDANSIALNRLEVEIYEKQADSSLVLVEQLGDTSLGNTPEGTGYYVNPSWYDLELLTQHYTYKDSQTYPWSAFETGGVYESPYANLLPSTYSPNIHLDNATFSDNRVGEFNGKTIAPAEFSVGASQYSLTLTYQKLKGVNDMNNLCIKARAIDAQGKATIWYEFQCQ